MSFFNEIPTMGRESLRDLKKGIDLNFKEFSRNYGDGIEGVFDPLLMFLVWLEKLLVNSPWPLVILVLAGLAWIGSRNLKLVAGTIACFLVIGYFVRVFDGSFKSEKRLSSNPKLVVGIVVDQMKYQYLTKYWDHYSERGFKKLINQGFNAKSNHYGYSQTSTGPGHTTVATGTYPRVHGIIGNSWFDRKSKKSVYCVDDENYNTIGSSSNSGK